MSPNLSGDDHRAGYPEEKGLLSGASWRGVQTKTETQLLLSSDRLVILDFLFTLGIGSSQFLQMRKYRVSAVFPHVQDKSVGFSKTWIILSRCLFIF